MSKSMGSVTRCQTSYAFVRLNSAIHRGLKSICAFASPIPAHHKHQSPQSKEEREKRTGIGNDYASSLSLGQEVSELDR